MIKPSGIRRFFDIANEMEDVISLSIGEPDFFTPWHIREEGITTLEKGRTRYTPNRGLMALREEICRFLKRKYDLEYDRSYRYSCHRWRQRGYRYVRCAALWARAMRLLSRSRALCATTR